MESRASRTCEAVKQRTLNLDDPQADEPLSPDEFLRLCDLERRGVIEIFGVDTKRPGVYRVEWQPKKKP